MNIVKDFEKIKEVSKKDFEEMKELLSLYIPFHIVDKKYTVYYIIYNDGQETHIKIKDE